LTRLKARLLRLNWRTCIYAALALVVSYLAALLLFFGKIGWSLLVIFGFALLVALLLLASQVAHIVLRGKT
jgi:hypothetical protein